MGTFSPAQGPADNSNATPSPESGLYAALAVLLDQGAGQAMQLQYTLLQIVDLLEARQLPIEPFAEMKSQAWAQAEILFEMKQDLKTLTRPKAACSTSSRSTPAGTTNE